MTDWANRITSYEYDANGRLTKTTRPNGTTQTITYDAEGQMLQMKDTDSSGTIICQYDFTYDPLGNILIEQGQAVNDTYTLDNSYDAGGNMLVGQAVYSGPSTVMTYTYDNRLATFNGQNVTYDKDGNMTYGPLNGAMVNFNWDARNRLTSVGNMSYLYDALNNRVSVTETVYGSPQETRYVIDPNPDLSQTLIKTDPDGSKTYYVYGLGLIGEEKDGTYRTYHYDYRGSTVALTDESGNVTDRYQYGPYGELLNHTGSSTTQFLYVGDDGVITDSNGLYYMRSRYYSPEIKRFISEDTFDGKYDELLNINLFEYANNNPVMNVDPEGEFVPLLFGAAMLAYRAWNAYDTYSDGKAAYYAWKRKDYKALYQSGFYFGLGLVGGKGAKYGGKFGVKVARYSKNGKYYKAAKGTGINVSSSVQRAAKKLSPEAKKGYEKAIKALQSGDTRGLNNHALKGSRKGQFAIYLKGTGKGRGDARIIYTKNSDGSINVIEVLTDHKKY